MYKFTDTKGREFAINPDHVVAVTAAGPTEGGKSVIHTATAAYYVDMDVEHVLAILHGEKPLEEKPVAAEEGAYPNDEQARANFEAGQRARGKLNAA